MSPSREPGPALHVFVDDVEAPRLDDGDRHHLVHVLRARPGEAVTASDGAGGFVPCRVRAEGALEPVGAVGRVDPPRPALSVGIALTKGGRLELAVQKLTELGVERILPFRAARSVVRWDDEGAARRLQRLRRVAREASMQSRRLHLPQVEPVSDFATVASLPGAALAAGDGDPPSLDRPLVLIGPEGGWAPEELGRDLPRVALGPHVLRAETAAMAAGALLAALRGGVVGPAGRPSPTGAGGAGTAESERW